MHPSPPSESPDRPGQLLVVIPAEQREFSAARTTSIEQRGSTVAGHARTVLRGQAAQQRWSRRRRTACTAPVPPADGVVPALQIASIGSALRAERLGAGAAPQPGGGKWNPLKIDGSRRWHESRASTHQRSLSDCVPPRCDSPRRDLCELRSTTGHMRVIASCRLRK